MNATRELVGRIIQMWRPRLGLEKWRIRYEIVGPGTLEGDDGECDADGAGRTALIRVTEHHDTEVDLHETVIHELFHCVFWFAEYEGTVQKLEEQAFLDFIPYLARQSVEEFGMLCDTK